MQDIALATPQEVEQTGIRRALLEDLALKLFGEPMSEVYSYRGLSHATLLVSGHDD